MTTLSGDLVPREALEDALDGLEEMIGYVPEYFREKWGHDAYIDRAREVLGLEADG